LPQEHQHVEAEEEAEEQADVVKQAPRRGAPKPPQTMSGQGMEHAVLVLEQPSPHPAALAELERAREDGEREAAHDDEGEGFHGARGRLVRHQRDREQYEGDTQQHE